MAAKPETKLKVGLVLDDTLDTPDGVQQYVLALGGWLTSQGHQVHYLVGKTHRTDLANIHSLSRNVGVKFNGNRMSIPLPASNRRLRALLAAEQFDVLHVQMPYSPFLAQKIIKSADSRTAVIGTFHILPDSYLAEIANHGLYQLLRPTLRRFDQIFSVSVAAQAFAKRYYHLDSIVIPNMIDYPRFHDAVPKKILPNDVLTVMYFGRLVPRKGCRTLLEAAVHLQSLPDVPGYRLLICGKGPEHDSLRDYAAGHGLDGYTQFTGFVPEDEKAALLAAADIAVFPSRGGESFGIVLLEAMASGHAAVLAGDNPGYRSVMEPQPDLLFDPGNSRQLAEKLLELMRDKKQRLDFAGWGSNYAASFDTTKVGAQILAEYRKALHKRR